jgi:glycosyltransferase involved in cell wall biosynthesis/GT2 family glycosyltransferase
VLKFDVVTPSLNQDAYVREAVSSVDVQRAPDIAVDHYLMDGGSTDSTLTLLEPWRASFKRFESGPDGGQASALKHAFALGDGEVLCWINSDDRFAPGAFAAAAAAFQAEPEVELVYGDCLLIDERSEPIGVSTQAPLDFEVLFRTPHLLNQESVFMRRSLYERIGGIDAAYWGAMDADLWLRAMHAGRARYLPQVLGHHRIVPAQKSAQGAAYAAEMRRSREAMAARLGVPCPPWPYDDEGRSRLEAAYEQVWAPVLKWRDAGLPDPMPRDVRALWDRYAQGGCLGLRGTTAFGWIAPRTAYVVDWQEQEACLELTVAAGDVLGSARQVTVRRDGNPLSTRSLAGAEALRIDAPAGRRFSLVELEASSAFVPALVGWGPTFAELSLACRPRSARFSVSSMPALGPASAPAPRAAAPARPPRPPRLRIALFNALRVGSGNEKFTARTAEGLLARGHDVRLYVREPGPARETPHYVRRLPYLPGERVLERTLRRASGLNDTFFPSTLLWRLRSFLRSADVWHFHNVHAHFASIPLLAAAAWTKPVLLSPLDQFLTTGYCPYTLGCEHYASGCGSCPQLGTPYPGISRDRTRVLRRMKRWSLGRSRAHLLLHTRYLEGHYREAFPAASLRTLTYGVDTQVFRPLPRERCRQALGLPVDDRLVVGAIHSHVADSRKGLMPAIRALQPLAERHPARLRVLVVGHGSEAALALRTPELDVRPLPFAHTESGLATILNACDVILYPTLAENLAFTTLEALSCGVPVISYDSGGQPEAVREGVSGLLVRPDPAAMAQAVARLLEGPEILAALVAGARSTALADYDFDRYLDRLIALYRELAGSRMA